MTVFFQAVAVWVISLPSTYILSLKIERSFGFAMNLGFLVWIAGILIETFADYQKYVFKNDPKNRDKWTDVGLWKYSRHPNYFGEMLCWWGIFIYTTPFLEGLYWLVIAGPIFITFILLFVSGIPPLEIRYDKKFAKNRNYQKYKRRTSLLIPLPVKK